jgi:hypothetical protein
MSGVLTAASFLFVVGCGAGRPGDAPAAGVPVPYETILDEAYSGLDEALSEVVQDQGSWAALWGRIHRGVSPQPPLLPVDFSCHMLIAVATGTRRSGGFGVAVREVAVHEDRLVVEVVETCPAKGGMVSMALTQPVAVVRLERLPQTPLFRHVKSPSCP